MNLTTLQQSLQNSSISSIESWNPPFCGDIPLHINAAGKWLYQGSEITRPALVKLFAAVLLFQAGEYYLQTPVEKVRITVADAPFVITNWSWSETVNGPALVLTTNLLEQVVVSPLHPLNLQPDPHQCLLPYVTLWRGLQAKLNRNVYYQLTEHVTAVYCNHQQHYQLKSAGYPYTLAIA